MGSDRRIYELMRRLVRKHEIHFLVIPSFRELCGMLGLEASNSRKRNTYTYEGIIGHRVEISNIVKKLWRKSLILAYALSMILLFPKVIRKLIEVNSEIIILNYPSVYTGLLGFFAAKFLRRPCVVDFNDLIAQYTIYLLDLEKSSFIGRAIVIIQDFIVRNSDVIVAPTSFTKRYALALGVKDEDISVIPNGVDIRVFKSRMKSDYGARLGLRNKKACLYFGRLDNWAGIHILTKLCSVFEKRRSDVKFLVVGGGGTERIEFPQNVVMIGEVPHYEIPKIITIADVVLIPFPQNEVSHAASPLKLFEAMAMAKPIVGSRVSGIKEVIQNHYNGLLVDPTSLKEWLEAIIAILDSESLSIKLRQNARKSVKKYDWNTLAFHFENVLLRTKK
jgi:glycosyltransferase involved in cell wall biosynthesis